MKVTGTDVVFLPISDFERSEAFYCFQAYFKDPDGNALILHHRYAPPGVQPGD